MEPRRPRIPRLVEGVDVRSLPLTPIDGFVLSRIDGMASIQDIADLTTLELGEVERIVGKLVGLGAAEWADGPVHLPKSLPPPPPSESGSQRASAGPILAARTVQVTEIPAEPRRPGAGRPSRPMPSEPARSDRPDPSCSETPAPEASASPSMPAPPDDGIELPPERRRRIDELYPLLDQLDHYQLLGLERSADAKQIRASYYELSKLFHPDTAFRKNLGPYKAKMEAIFKRLTEAYEVLGKKKSRAEYDAYLALRGITSEAERAIAAPEREPLAPPAQAAATATARPPAAPEPVRPSAASPEAEGAAPSSGPVRSPGLPAGASAAPEPCMPSGDGRTMSEEAKKKFRELWAKRFAALRGPPNRTPPMPPRSPEDIGRDLVHSLKRSSEVTKGAALDLVDPLVPDATRSELAGDLAAAVRHMRLAVALAPDRADLHADSARLSRRLAEQLAPRYRQQAEYEERHKKWKAAAASWLKVVEGYPDDPEVLCRAAVALVEARGDLHHAHRLAQRACELRPDDAVAHEVLGRVCLAAGLSLNARRALERAAMLDPHNEIVKNLLSALKT